MNGLQEDLDELKQELNEKMSRRKFLALTTAQAAGIALGATLAGGIAGYLAGREVGQRTITQTKTETITQEKTIVNTTTLTSTATYTTTKEITSTKTIYGAKLDEANFIKSYSSNALNFDIKLKFNPRSEVTSASLNFIYPYEVQIPLRSDSEQNVYVGNVSIRNPKPVEHLAVWDAKTKDGIIASDGLSERDRSIIAQMPLKKEEYEALKDLADSLFSYTLTLDTFNTEKTFKLSLDTLVETGNTNIDKRIREAVVKYAFNITKNNLNPYELSYMSAFITNLKNLINQYPNIFDAERSALPKLAEPQEHLVKYYFYPYLVGNIPELQRYPFFANSAALQAARIINNYLSLNLTHPSDREKAFLVLDKVIVPRLRARINWFEKGEYVLPITGKELIDLMGREEVALIKLADSIVSHADFQFFSFRDINTESPLIPVKPGYRMSDFIENAIYNTDIMLNGSTAVSHSRVWHEINDSERIKIYLEGNTYISQPSHWHYELFKFWAEVYVPFIWENGTYADRIALLWFRYGPVNLLKKCPQEVIECYIHEENRKSISQLAAESVGDSVYVINESVPGRSWALHGDIMISLSDKIWKGILNNKEKFLTPFYIEIVNGIPNRDGIKEKWLEPFRKQSVSKPWMVWYTSTANMLSIYEE
ncbi:MAG: hypothetical protein QW156_01985 [Candidatus Aenigmatarchaeota archaeon]